MRPTDSFDLRRAPMLPFALAAAVGVLFAVHVEIGPELLGILSLGLAITSALVLWRVGSGLAGFGTVLVFVVALTAFRGAAELDRNVRRRVHELALQNTEVTAIGRVQVPGECHEQGCDVLLDRVELRADSASLPCGSLRVRVFADSGVLSGLRSGDLVWARGRLRSSTEHTTPAGLVRALTGCVTAVVYADSADVLSQRAGGFAVRRGLDGLRAAIVHAFDRHLGPDGAALCKALILGERSGFSEEFSEKLRVTGLTHVFALSGMNVGFLVTMVWMLLGLFPLPRSVRLIVVIAFTLAYMEVGREAPSLVRASLMVVVYAFGHLLHRHVEAANSVLAAAFMELLWRPLDILDAGFLLSYAAVFGILAAFGPIRAWLANVGRGGRLARTGANLAAVTIAAQIGVLPLLMFLFRRIPLLGAAANVIAVPAFAVLQLWAVFLLLCSWLVPPATAVISPAIDGLSYGLGRLVDLFASLPLAALPIPQISLFSFLVLALAVGFLLWALVRGRHGWSLGFALLCVNVIVWSAATQPQAPLCRITFIPVGNGDAALISAGRGANVLVDAGPSYDGWSAAERIIGVLESQRVSRLDALILTHPDNDHIGGAAELIRRMPIGHVLTNSSRSFTRTFLELQLALDVRRIRTEPVEAGDRIELSKDVDLLVLWPDSAALADARNDNEASLVLRLQCEHQTALLTADIDSTVEHQLMTWSPLLHSDLLKIAHHGSPRASSMPFLCAVSPEYCVISVGRWNRHGHPDPAVLERLRTLHIPVLKTSTDGILTFAATATGWVRKESAGDRLSRLWKIPYG